MNINFPPVDDNYIKSKVDNGYYSNATELVRDAVRRMRERDTGMSDQLLAALELGEEDIRAGRTVPYTPTLLDECAKEAIENVAKGIMPDPDVCP